MAELLLLPLLVVPLPPVVLLLLRRPRRKQRKRVCLKRSSSKKKRERAKLTYHYHRYREGRVRRGHGLRSFRLSASIKSCSCRGRPPALFNQCPSSLISSDSEDQESNYTTEKNEKTSYQSIPPFPLLPPQPIFHHLSTSTPMCVVFSNFPSCETDFYVIRGSEVWEKWIR